jgi:hypothetical protein
MPSRTVAALAATTTLAVGVGGPIIVNEVQVATLPAHERLVSNDIIGIAYRDDTVVEYVVPEDEPAPALPNEISELRTELSQTYIEDGEYRTVFGERRRVKRNGKWHDVQQQHRRHTTCKHGHLSHSSRHKRLTPIRPPAPTRGPFLRVSRVPSSHAGAQVQAAVIAITQAAEEGAVALSHQVPSMASAKAKITQ